MVDANIFTQVEAFVGCRHLPKLDVLSDSDPFVVVYQQDPLTSTFIKIGQTEVIKDNHNPDFVKQFLLEYHFEENQKFRFDVYDMDDEAGHLDDQDFIGTTTIVLGELVASPGQVVTKQLVDRQSQKVYNKKTREPSIITVKCEEVAANHDSVTLQFSAEDLPNQGFCCGHCDAFVEISRSREDGTWMPVMKTEVIPRCVNPFWESKTIAMQLLNNGDIDRPLWLKCYHQRLNTSPVLIGEQKLSLQDMKPGMEINFKQHHGSLMIRQCKVLKGYSMLDYIRGGCQISLMVAIDFTASNGDPSDPTSLHYIRNADKLNEYQSAILSIGQVLAPYDSDQMFPVWGFGAKIGGKVSHCFSLTFDEYNPEVQGVQGILDCYAQSFANLRLSGPTLFSQIISTASAMAATPFKADSQHYNILLILTDGVINDMPKTIDAIVDASDKPLSIIIVGVGGADFSNMETLDADDDPLVSSAGVKMKRDIVQFVPYRSLEIQGLATLAKETLAEVPTQFLDFMKFHEIAPIPPGSYPADGASAPANQPGYGYGDEHKSRDH